MHTLVENNNNQTGNVLCLVGCAIVLRGETEQVIALGRAMRAQVPESASAVASFRIDALPNSVSYRDMLTDRFHFRAALYVLF